MSITARFTLCNFILVVANGAAQQQDPQWGSTSSTFSRQSSGEVFRSILVHGSYIVVGSNMAVYVLDYSFNVVTMENLTTPNRPSPVNPASAEVLLCGNKNFSQSPVCSIATCPSWSYSWSSSMPSVISNIAVTGNLVAGELAVDSQGNFIFVYGDNDIFVMSGTVFLTSFSYNNFGYFVFQLSTNGTAYQIRVARAYCGNETISTESFQLLSTYYEIALTCHAPGQSSSAVSIPTAASFLPSSSAFNYDPTILVSSVIAGNNYLCAYSLTTINNLMNQKYNSCINGVGVAGLARAGSTVACNSIYQPQGVQNVLVNGLEMDHRLSNPPINVVSGEAPVSSVVAADVDNHTLMFVGRTDASLSTFYIANSSYAVFIRQVSLPVTSDPSLTNVTALATSQAGEYLYALTPSQLFRQPVNMCGSYLTCSDCVTSSDPICGWCSLNKMCVRSKDCPSDPDLGRSIWVQQLGLCPVITGISPSTIYLPTRKVYQNVTLSITNIPPLTYSCAYSYSTVIAVTAGTTLSNSSIVCPSPMLSSISIPPSQDNLKVQLSLQRNGINMATLQGSISFTNCSRNTDCVSCTREQECVWCSYNFFCITPSDIACCSNAQSVNTAGSCPQILPPNQPGSQYLVHTNTTSQLILNGMNLLPFSNLRCVGTVNGTVVFNTSANATDKAIDCFQSSKFVYSGGSPAITAYLAVQVMQSHKLDNPGNYGVTLYNCSLLGTNCAQCLSLDPSFMCATVPMTDLCLYTPGAMVTRSANISTCPRLKITQLTPRAGPSNGGTQITITGTNLGHAASDIATVSIAGVGCTVDAALYEPGVKIVCTTEPADSSLNVQDCITVLLITGAAAGSSTVFAFQVPRLTTPPGTPSNYSFSPPRGPIAGGTNLSIWGEYLNIGSTLRVTVGMETCQLTKIGPNLITCTTSPSTSPLSNVLVQVTIDNWSTTAGDFSYLADPTYLSIQPPYSFVKGGITYTINGTGFSAIQYPVMLLYVSSSKRQSNTVMVQSQPCSLVSDSEITCVSPDISGYTTGNVVVSIGLLMDGVQALLHLNTYLAVYAQPTFITQQYTLSRDGDGVITIQGTGFLFTKDQVSVTLSPCQDGCTGVVLSVTNTTTPNTLQCKFENISILPVNVKLTLNVTLGNQVANVGTIVVTQPVSTNNINNLTLITILVPVLATLVLVGGALVTCVVAALCHKARQKEKKCKQLKQELEQMELVGAKRADSLASTGPDQDFITQYTGTIIPYVQIQIRNTIGEGEFGVVYRAHLLRKGTLIATQVVAVKTLKGLFTKNDLSSMMDEILKMQDFHHPHVMTLIGVSFDANHTPTMVMPFMANGSLLSYLKNNRITLLIPDTADQETLRTSQKVLTKMCHQVALGMEYLAGKKFIHRDLAARNCMIDGDGVIKVGDFGLSEDVYRTGYFRQDKGSSGVRLPFKWLAPESIQDGVFNEKTDVWSYGVTCWEVFTCGKLPYAGVDPTDLPKFLERGRRLEKPENAACPETMYSLMLKCWDSDPEDRPSFTKIGTTISRALETMSEYLDISLLACMVQTQSQATCQSEDIVNAEATVDTIANGHEEYIANAEATVDTIANGHEEYIANAEATVDTIANGNEHSVSDAVERPQSDP